MNARRRHLLLLGVLIFGGHALPAAAQHVWRDYHVNVPRQYAPTDPWKVGVVMRQQMGHGGMWYNCDCEEQKRFSPYIDWNRQACVTCCNGPLAQFHQQVDEIKQRVRTGSCKQSQFCLSPECQVCEDYHPAVCNWQTSSDPCGAWSAAQAGSTPPASSPAPADEATPYGVPQPAPIPPAPATAPANESSTNSASWLRDLYRSQR